MSMIMAVHAGAGALALGAGGSALVFRKGSHRHRHTGGLFVIAMLTMAVTAMPLAYQAGNPMDIFSATLVIYLVLTAWTTFRNDARRSDIGLLVVGIITLAGYLWVEWEAMRSGIRRPDVPVGAGYLFALVMALALAGDVRRMHSGLAQHYRRLIRHLWRMCFALLMASVSFFLSRAHLFPGPVQASGILYLLAMAPVIVMLFWWLRMRWGVWRMLRQMDAGAQAAGHPDALTSATPGVKLP